jgi:Flp pilus assembly CpaE family ATPase
LRRSERAQPDTRPDQQGLFASATAAIETLVMQGTCGGAGTTTLAVNLAAEIAACNALESGAPAVCLLDLNLQFGGVANYLDLRETSHVSDVYRNLARLDSEAFTACTQSAGNGLQVFTTPPDLIPMDALRGEGFARLLECARSVAPLVVIDMPPIVTDWSEQAYGVADRILCISLLDVRAAHNARKMTAIMRRLGVPQKRVKHLLNRALPDGSRDWKLRLEHFELGLSSGFDAMLPEGGAEIGEACDLGHLLGKSCPSNPLAKEIRRLARTLPVQSATATAKISEVHNVDL